MTRDFIADLPLATCKRDILSEINNVLAFSVCQNRTEMFVARYDRHIVNFELNTKFKT